jgi:hypothetical protein
MPDTAPLNRTKMIDAATRSTRLSHFGLSTPLKQLLRDYLYSIVKNNNSISLIVW